ncbi:MAG: 16S rRNA (cytosine(967)-C(5))-methyltransferase RsmB [Gemmataceae bacterium]
MTRPLVSTARGLALHVLDAARMADVFAHELLDEQLTHSSLSPADGRLATTLVYGVLRRRASLDALVRPFINRSLDKVEAWLMDALRLGAHQLVLLTHVPPHAALNETVELAADFGRPDAKRFLNGVLRRVAEMVTGDFLASPAGDAMPFEAGSYRRLTRPVLPDPAKLPIEYLAAGFSWPRWLAERWLPRYGWDECVRLGFWFVGPAPVWLRVNPLRTDRDSLLNRLAEAGVKAESGEYPQSIRLTDSASIRDLPGYAEGHFTVQDESAQRVAAALNPQPDTTVLDLCAAPGGKTTHLAELMHNQGKVIACDSDAGRLATVGELVLRLGLSIIEPMPPAGDPPNGPFDAVLVDAPCSNTGVLGRRPEVRWRLQPAELTHLVALQTRLLLMAGHRLKPGGALVYSTCSIEPEENGQVVRAVLRGMGQLRLEDEQAAVPGHPADGGYWVRLRRQS